MEQTDNKILDYKKVLLIYNPKSGNGMFSMHLDMIIERFQEKGYVIRPVRGSNYDILDYVFRKIHEEDYRQIIVAGGDGTINVVVNLMMKYGIELPIAIFPAGTANDFAYYFNIPHDIKGMIDVALGEHYEYVDVACANGLYYINVAALGNIVDVSQKTDPNLKNSIGVLAYYLRGLAEVPSLKPIPVKLTTDDAIYEENMFFMLVMNGCSAGGFKHISPNSDMTDGLLDVLLFRVMQLHEIVPLLINVLQGNHPENRNVLHFKTDNLLVESSAHVGTDVDGEKGEKLPLRFSVLPKKLKLLTKERK